mmetsp:Transcript_18652/g.47286  ORF Transcript_18652/g.47286 Transcript_18652/m.47286 type:complete len:202 (-) Transcript_18652:252-857(-)
MGDVGLDQQCCPLLAIHVNLNHHSLGPIAHHHSLHKLVWLEPNKVCVVGILGPVQQGPRCWHQGHCSCRVFGKVAGIQARHDFLHDLQRHVNASPGALCFAHHGLDGRTRSKGAGKGIDTLNSADVADVQEGWSVLLSWQHKLQGLGCDLRNNRLNHLTVHNRHLALLRTGCHLLSALCSSMACHQSSAAEAQCADVGCGA